MNAIRWLRIMLGWALEVLLTEAITFCTIYEGLWLLISIIMCGITLICFTKIHARWHTILFSRCNRLFECRVFGHIWCILLLCLFDFLIIEIIVILLLRRHHSPCVLSYSLV